jgi:hypothetical protein
LTPVRAFRTGTADPTLQGASKQHHGRLQHCHGDQALSDNTAGNFNTAVAVDALDFNTAGSGNSAIGFQALSQNITGNANTATGYGALFSNTLITQPRERSRFRTPPPGS